MSAKDPEYTGVVGVTEHRLMTLLDEYKLNENFKCSDQCYHESTGALVWANMTDMERGMNVQTKFY